MGKGGRGRKNKRRIHQRVVGSWIVGGGGGVRQKVGLNQGRSSGFVGLAF